jgi:hypothetical protein
VVNPILDPSHRMADRMKGHDAALAGLSTQQVTVDGFNVAGQVASALNADGSAYAFNNVVPGTSTFPVYVGNDGVNHIGRATSSIRYKCNVRAHTIDPSAVLKLQPVLFDRHPVMVPPADGSDDPPTSTPSSSNEYGLIAEQVHEHVPELVQWFGGNIDGLRYDLLPVAQQSVLIDHDGRIATLEAQLAAALALIRSLATQIQAPILQWSPPKLSSATYVPPGWKPNV